MRQLHHCPPPQQDTTSMPLEPGNEQVLPPHPASHQHFSSLHPHLWGCSPSLLLPAGTQQTGAKRPAAAAPPPATAFLTQRPFLGNTLTPKGRRVLERRHIYLKQAPHVAGAASFFQKSQSLKPPGPECQTVLACILQSSRGSSSFAAPCKR